MRIIEVEVLDRKLKLSPLTLGEWKTLREKFKGDDQSTELFIEACVISTKKNHAELTEDFLRSHFSNLTAGFMTSADGAIINAILGDQRDAIIRLESEKRKLQDLKEEAELNKEIEQLKQDIGDLNFR